MGLTATPERADGQDIRRWFDGRTAVELSDRPMRILWRLARPLPADVFHGARVASG